jgi:hypothetical protein
MQCVPEFERQCVLLPGHASDLLFYMSQRLLVLSPSGFFRSDLGVAAQLAEHDEISVGVAVPLLGATTGWLCGA